MLDEFLHRGHRLRFESARRVASRLIRQTRGVIAALHFQHYDVKLPVRPGQEEAHMVDATLIAAFSEEMFLIYPRAHSEVHYNASRFLQMLHEHRGLETARILLHSINESEGYTALRERGRLDLTIEAIIHDNPKWHPLFTVEELAICTKQLTEYRYLQ